MNNTRPKVSIILPCLNEADYIEDCMRSILAQVRPEGGMECIVADGMSDDGTREILEQFSCQDSRIRIIENRGKSIPAGLNAAIREARGDIVIRMDAHTEYAPDYIVRCVAILQSVDADNIGGPARTRADSYFQKANALAYHSAFSVGGAKFHNPEYEGYVDTVAYGCWRRETLLRLGLFDTELLRNEDDELNLRLLRAGGKIWQSPEIRSWYSPRSSASALFRQYMQYGYWKVRVIQKHRLPASIRHLVPGGFVGILLALSFLSLFFSRAQLALAGLLGLYLCVNFSASLFTCFRPKSWKYLPIMPPVFAAYHFGYGWGFLRGAIDFLLLKKGGQGAYAKLTR